MNSNANKIRRHPDAIYDDCLRYYEQLINKCVPEGKTAIAFFRAELWREEEIVTEDSSFWQTYLGENYEDIYYDKISYFGLPITSDNLASLDEMQYLQEQLNQYIKDFYLFNASVPQFNFRVHKWKFDQRLYEQYPAIYPLEVPRRYLDYFLTGNKKLEAYPEITEDEQVKWVKVTLLDNDQIDLIKTNFQDECPDRQGLHLFRTNNWFTYYRPQCRDYPMGEITIETGLDAKIRSNTWVNIDHILLRLVENAVESGVIDDIGHLEKDGFRAIKTYYDTFMERPGDKEKFNVVFEGFDTLEQADAFVDWYCDGGEQDSALWLFEATDLECAIVDVTLPTRYEDNNAICPLKLRYKEN